MGLSLRELALGGQGCDGGSPESCEPRECAGLSLVGRGQASLPGREGIFFFWIILFFY